jgi:hypothetical protein
LWGWWQDRQALYFQQDMLWLQERYGREDCGSGLSRESSWDDINSEGEQHFEYEQVSCTVFTYLNRHFTRIPAVLRGSPQA